MNTARLNSSSSQNQPEQRHCWAHVCVLRCTTLRSGECGPVQDLIGSYEEGKGRFKTFQGIAC